MRYLLVLMMFLSVPAWGGDETRVATSLNGSRYNELANQYIDGATFATLVVKKKKTYLLVEVELFGEIYPGIPNKAYMRFLKSEVDGYLQLIDKYIEWESLAMQRGDQFTKDIGKHKDARGKLKFTFHSGNEYKHLLSIVFCSWAGCADHEPVAFDKENVKELRSLLVKLKAGELQSLNVDDIYN